MATLEKIDRIKTELQTAKQGLHEADNWTVLANDVEEVYIKIPVDFLTHIVIECVMIVNINYGFLNKTGIRIWRHRSDI